MMNSLLPKSGDFNYDCKVDIILSPVDRNFHKEMKIEEILKALILWNNIEERAEKEWNKIYQKK